MKVTKNQLIGTLGGFAVLAGAGYYLYKRNKAANMTPFQRFQQHFARIKMGDISTLQQQFDLLFHLEVGQYILTNEYLQSTVSNEEEMYTQKKQRHCGKVIQSGYRCYDCYPDDQFSKEDIIDLKQKQTGEMIFLHIICEDCFDEKIHKGHTYIQHPLDFLAYCDCGVSRIYKESSFCAEHCGFKNLKQEYTESYPEDVKQRLESLFNHLISFLIDIAYQQTTSKAYTDKNKQSLNSKFDILLNLIENQIIQMIQDNPIHAFFFQEYVLKPFDLPTYIVTSNSKKLTFLSSKQKSSDASKTMLDILFMLIPLMNESSNVLLTQVFREIGSADYGFYADLAIKFQKYHSIILDIFLNQDQCKHPNLFFRISDLYTSCLNGLKIDEMRKRVILDNQEDVLNVVKMFTQLTKRFKFEANFGAEWFIQLNYNNHIASICMLPSIYNNYQYSVEIFQEFVNQFIYFADAFQLGEKGVSFVEDFSKRNVALFYNMLIQQIILENIFIFTYKLIKDKNDELGIKIKKVLSESYQKEVERLYEENKQFAVEEKLPKFNIGIKLLYFIIFILLLENQPFNREGIKNAIKNNFPLLQTDEEIRIFADKILYMLRAYVPQEIQQIKQDESAYICLQKQIHKDRLDIWANEMTYFWLPQFSNYDLFTMTYQIFNLLGSQMKRSAIIEASGVSFRFKNVFLRNQVIFDQTPFINLIYDPDEELLLNDESITRNIEKAAQSTIIGVIQIHKNLVTTLQQLMQQINEFIGNEKITKKQLAIICNIVEEKNQFKLKNKPPESFHLFNQGRMFQVAETPYIKHYYESIEHIAKNRKFYQDLFDFQKQLLIKEYASFTFFSEIEKLITSKIVPVLRILYLLNEAMLLFEAMIEMSHEEKGLFTEQESEETQKIENIFYSEEYMKFMLQQYHICILELLKSQSPRKDIQLFFDAYYDRYQAKYNKTIDF